GHKEQPAHVQVVAEPLPQVVRRGERPFQRDLLVAIGDWMCVSRPQGVIVTSCKCDRDHKRPRSFHSSLCVTASLVEYPLSRTVIRQANESSSHTGSSLL